MPVKLPAGAWRLIGVLGALLATVFALIPVGVDFGDDPLLRLRQLDPSLASPTTSVVCGSPISHLSPRPAGPGLYELAKASACRDAARRRLLAACAGGMALLVLALSGLAAGKAEPRPPRAGRTRAVRGRAPPPAGAKTAVEGAGTVLSR